MKAFNSYTVGDFHLLHQLRVFYIFSRHTENVHALRKPADGKEISFQQLRSIYSASIQKRADLRLRVPALLFFWTPDSTPLKRVKREAGQHSSAQRERKKHVFSAKQVVL